MVISTAPDSEPPERVATPSVNEPPVTAPDAVIAPFDEIDDVAVTVVNAPVAAPPAPIGVELMLPPVIVTLENDEDPVDVISPLTSPVRVPPDNVAVPSVNEPPLAVILPVVKKFSEPIVQCALVVL